MRPVMKSMQKSIKEFYIQESRFPNEDDIDRLVQEAGCIIIDLEQKRCQYKKNIFFYHETNVTVYPEPTKEQTPIQYKEQSLRDVTPIVPPHQEGIKKFEFGLSKQKSYCTIRITIDGDIGDIECRQGQCFEMI
jgi:hypothetical protein